MREPEPTDEVHEFSRDPGVQTIIGAAVDGATTYAIVAIAEDPDDPNDDEDEADELYVSKLTRVGPAEADDAELEVVLDTNDTLTAVWVSPSGAIWTVSAFGNLYTTAYSSAPASWPDPEYGELDVEVFDPALAFTITTLPPLANGEPPWATALWGTGDDDVWIGTQEGAIYRWDGAALRRLELGEMDRATPRPIQAIHGAGPDAVYVVGRGGLALRWDGQRLHTLALPAELAHVGPNLSDVLALDRDRVLVCSPSGRLLHGGPGGLELLTELDTGAYPGARLGQLARLAGRVFVSGGDAGLFELRGDQLERVRDTFTAATVRAGADRLVMIPTTPELSLGFYAPAAAEPWFGADF